MTSNDLRAFVSVVIPARDEEAAVGRVLRDIPWDAVDEVIVVDNGSVDATAEVARQHGAAVVREGNYSALGAAGMKGFPHRAS